MASNGSHLKPRISTIEDRAAGRLCIPLVPTLLVTLAVMNVTSVVLVLID